MTLEPRLIVPLVAGAILLALIVLSASAIAVWPAWTRRRTLKARARQDYLNARGTAHRDLLNTALRQAEIKAAEVGDLLAKARNSKRVAESRRHREMEAALAEWIVSQHLRDVYGIGRKLQQEIVRTVFRGSLADLHRAYMAPGVGSQRQSAISAWVRQWEVKKPGLMRSGFPGSKEIDERYEFEIRTQAQRISVLAAELDESQAKIKSLKQALATLDAVTEKDFLRSLQHPEEPSEQLTAYLRGVFEEWEPIPNWFREVVEE